MQLTVFTDGGARGNPGPAAVGAVVQDDSGQIVFEISEYIGVATNNEAEYTAVLSVLTWLTEHKNHEDYAEVRFNLDSMLVVQQLNKIWKIKESRLQVLATNCWELLKKLRTQYSFHHVPREKNALADTLVNRALDKQLL